MGTPEPMAAEKELVYTEVFQGMGAVDQMPTEEHLAVCLETVVPMRDQQMEELVLLLEAQMDQTN